MQNKDVRLWIPLSPFFHVSRGKKKLISENRFFQQINLKTAQGKLSLTCFLPQYAQWFASTPLEYSPWTNLSSLYWVTSSASPNLQKGMSVCNMQVLNFPPVTVI